MQAMLSKTNARRLKNAKICTQIEAKNGSQLNNARMENCWTRNKLSPTKKYKAMERVGQAEVVVQVQAQKKKDEIHQYGTSFSIASFTHGEY